MSTATTVTPPTAAGGEPGDRRRLVVGAVVALVLVAVAALLARVLPADDVCEVLADDPVRPPAAVTRAVRAVRDGVPRDVATLTVTCRLSPAAQDPDPLAADPRDDPASWVVGVDAQAVDVPGAVPAAGAVLAAAPADAPFTWDLRVRDAARSFEVVLTAGGGTALVADAVALRESPGVAETWFGPDGGRVAVAGGQDVVPLLRATAGRALPVTTVETRDTFVEVRQVHPGTWPQDDAVTLALDVAGWDGVWRVLLTGGAPATTDLHVDVADDAQRAWVADRLDVLVGASVPYHVTSPAATVDGVVGGAVGAGTAGATAPSLAPAGADGVPACTGDELEVEVLGHDAAAGARFLFLRATHVGSTTCVVQGVPGLAFTRASGTPTPDLTQLPELAAPDVPPVVALVPGGVVDAQVRWRAMSTSQDPDVAVAVSVRAVVGGPTAELALPDPLDVLAGATVEVGPWQVPAA